MEAITDFILAIAGSPWIYLALALFIVIDGFFPPVPSETLLVAVAALAASAGGPNLWLLVAVAALAATAGDTIAFFIGRRVGLSRWRWMRRPRTVASFAWARRELDRRSASLLLTVKFIPVARVAVTMTAGATGFPLRRYLPLAFSAGALWTMYSVGIGLLAGAWLGHNPVLSVIVAVSCALAMGLVVDAIMRRVARSRARGRRLEVVGHPREPMLVE